jgi:hypothetical protein
MARTKPLEQDGPLDFARGILDQVIAKHDPETSKEAGKNPSAVALGLRGGAKGGHARARKLSTKRKKEIAKKAARARWSGRG